MLDQFRPAQPRALAARGHDPAVVARSHARLEAAAGRIARETGVRVELLAYVAEQQQVRAPSRTP